MGNTYVGNRWIVCGGAKEVSQLVPISTTDVHDDLWTGLFTNWSFFFPKKKKKKGKHIYVQMRKHSFKFRYPFAGFYNSSSLQIQWEQIQISGATLARVLPAIHLLDNALFVFGGSGPGEPATSTAEPFYMRPGCNPGSASADFLQLACMPCPRGSFQNLPGQTRCNSCPGGTYTSQPGQIAASSCNECEPGFCTGDNGVCSVVNGAAQCNCASGFVGARCNTTAPQGSNGGSNDSNNSAITKAWAVPVAIIILAIVTTAVAMFVRSMRRRKTYHIFISYRVNTDRALALRVCDALQQHYLEPNMKIKCFLDRQDIRAGSDWEKSFLTALHRSCLFLPIVSEGALKPIEDVSVFDDMADNVLLEYETALRLKSKKKVAIFPLLVGEVNELEQYVRFSKELFDVQRYPNGPSKTKRDSPVRETMRKLFRIQGVFVNPLVGISEQECGVALEFLRTKTWTGKDPECLQFKCHWQNISETAAMNEMKSSNKNRKSLMSQIEKLTLSTPLLLSLSSSSDDKEGGEGEGGGHYEL